MPFLVLISFHIFAFAQFEEYGLKGKFYEGRFLVYASDYNLAREVGLKVRHIFTEVIEDIGYVGVYRTNYQILIWKDKGGFIKFLKNTRADIPKHASALAIYNFKGLPTIVGFNNSYLKNHLAHEFTHLLLPQILDVEERFIPLWLNEGLASYEGEKHSLKGVYRFLKDNFVKERCFRLSRLLVLKDYPEDSLENKIFYAQATSLVDFLLSLKPRREKFFSFLRWYVTKGYSFEQAYLYAYNERINLEALEEKWQEYIRKQ